MSLAELERGTSEILPLEEFRSRIKEAAAKGIRLRIKAGFDPTARDLHLGHTVLLNKMRAFQDAGHEAVFLMDLHTGYGERGVLHYFGDAGPRSGDAMKAVFAGYPIDSAETNPDFYETNGDLVVWFGQIIPETKIYIGTTLEYGTLDSQTLIGGIRSLQRMRLENQGFHHGFSSESVKRGVLQRFADMFDPPDSRWRAGIMQTTLREVPILVGRFQSL